MRPIAWIGRRLGWRSTVASRTRPDRRQARPQVDGLETRDLLTILAIKVEVTPQILPPSGRFVPVTITGAVADSRKLPPNVNYQIIDEYSEVEGRGRLSLRRIGDKFFEYGFTVHLKASVPSSDIPGRNYYVVIAAQDPGKNEPASGKVIPILVPSAPLRGGPLPTNVDEIESSKTPATATATVKSPAPTQHATDAPTRAERIAARAAAIQARRVNWNVLRGG